MRRRYLLAACVALMSAGVLVAYWLKSHEEHAVRGVAASSASVSSTANQKMDAEDGAAEAKAKRVAAKDASLSLPPADAPLKDVFSELQARANAGEKAAATRLYRDLNHCVRLRGIGREYLRMTDETLGQNPGEMDSGQLDNYQAQLEAIENNRHVLGKMQENCAGVSDAMYASLVPNLQRAAELGDADARACYLSRGPLFDMRNSAAHPEWFDAYRDHARTLIDAGIAAGDWKVVDILRGAYEPGSASPLAGLLGSDPYQYYRYLKLFRAGAGQGGGAGLDRQLADAAADLTPAQLGDADAWASQTFSKSFQGRSPDSANGQSDACLFP